MNFDSKNLQFYQETQFKEVELNGRKVKIPKEWRVVKLGDIASEMYYGITAKAVDWKTNFRMLRTTDIFNYQVNWEKLPFCEITEKRNNYTKYLIRKGDLLIARAGTVGVSVLAEKDFDNIIFGSYLIKIRLRDEILPKFVHYYFQSSLYWDHVNKAQGSTLRNINLSLLKSLCLLVPPIEEQRKIAEILKTIDEAIEAVDEAIVKLERIKRGTMEKLLTKGLGHTEFKEVELNGRKVRIPTEWRIVKLGDIGEIVSGYSFPLRLQGKKEGKYPFIKVADMNLAYKYITRSANYVNEADLKELKAKPFPPGTIIFPKIGMAMRLNKFKILKCEALFDNNIGGVIPSSEINVEFLYYFFLWNIDLISLAGMTTVPSITKSKLRGVRVLVPSLQEQRKIAEILMTVDEALELKKKKKEKLERIKKAVMEKLLTGEVRVRRMSLGRNFYFLNQFYFLILRAYYV